MRCSGVDRPAGDLAGVSDEAGDKVLIGPVRNPIAQLQPHDLVARAPAAVPRAVQGDEGVAAVLGGKGAAAATGLIETDPQWGGAWLDQHVRQARLAGEVGPQPFQPRVLAPSNVEPRPAVEAAFAHPARVVGRQVVAQVVPSLVAHQTAPSAG